MLIWLGKNRLGQVDKQPEERATETLGLINEIIAKASGKDESKSVPQTTTEHPGQ